MNPPLVVMTSSVNTAPINSSFKEVASFSMNDVQKQTMKALVEDDLKIEKLRGAKVSITLDDDQENKKEIVSYSNDINTHNKNKINQKISNNKTYFPNDENKQIYQNKNNLIPQIKNNFAHDQFINSPIQNGPLNINTLNFNTNQFASFAELSSESNLQGAPKYTQPIEVQMKQPSDPDPKLKKEIGNIEKKREGFEAKVFKKAKEEFKLITALTKKELQINLNHELLPFFVVSKNSLSGINDVIKANFPSKNQAKFLQVDPEEMKQKFPNVKINDQVALNTHVYARILDFLLEDKEKFIPNLSSNVKSVRNKNIRDNNLRKQNKNTSNILKGQLDFNYKKCLELSQNFKNLNCNEKMEDYNQLNDHIYSSFIQTKGADDFINVKFAASDEPYPTIEKLVAQMMTRRDLAEKFIRLKILEYESHLQKAENEMIQDILHDQLYKIMATYGPAIEGMKEHVH